VLVSLKQLTGSWAPLLLAPFALRVVGTVCRCEG
jgi:hypothetical protein